MKIHVAKSAGFCFGVKRAIELAKVTVKNKSNVYMLGDIVHNDTVISEIKKSGIKKVLKLTPGKGKTLLIRAHGTAKKTIHEAKKMGFEIVDATCPMVKEIHKIAKKKEQEGYSIIIIGDKKHDEVRGIIGQLTKKPRVIENIDSPFFKKPPHIGKAAVVVQSTQNPDKVLMIAKKLSSYIDDLEFHDTICDPTKVKQGEAKKLPLNNDVILVIGSKSSANTKRLYEISRSINSSTYWIGSDKEISPGWFEGASSVGITAGASTPDQVIEKVIGKIKKIS